MTANQTIISISPRFTPCHSYPLSPVPSRDFDIPAEVIPGSVHADLKIYPDLLAHVTTGSNMNLAYFELK